MSDMKRTADDFSPDLAVIAADDLLLDALGRRDPAPADDPVAGILAAWRTDLGGDEAGTSGGAHLGGGEAGTPGDAGLGPGTRRRGARRRLAAGAAAAAVLAAGLGLATNHAGPGSPLWPVTQVVYPQEAGVRAADHTIGRARAAAAGGRYDDARRLLDEAAAHALRIRDPDVAGRLRAEIDEIRRTLPGVVPDPPGTPASAPSPAASSRTTPPAPAPAGGATPLGPADPGGEKPQLPGLPPLSTPEVPLPVLPAPRPPTLTPLIPHLPLPPRGILGDS